MLPHQLARFSTFTHLVCQEMENGSKSRNSVVRRDLSHYCLIAIMQGTREQLQVSVSPLQATSVNGVFATANEAIYSVFGSRGYKDIERSKKQKKT